MSRPIKFASMSLTALRAYAKEELGLSGLSKAPRERVQAAINVARQAKPMDNERRSENYWLNSTRTELTHRQQRRIRKHARKALG